MNFVATMPLSPSDRPGHERITPGKSRHTALIRLDCQKRRSEKADTDRCHTDRHSLQPTLAREQCDRGQCDRDLDQRRGLRPAVMLVLQRLTDAIVLLNVVLDGFGACPNGL